MNCGLQVAAAGGTDAMANYASLRGPVGINRTYAQVPNAAADPALRHLPVVAMTANALAQDRQRCLDAGMDDYLSKPIRQPALIEVLTRFAGTAKADGRVRIAEAAAPGWRRDDRGDNEPASQRV